MIQVDDIVKSKNQNGSVKVPGKVVAIWDGLQYSAKMSRLGINMLGWDQQFPGWQGKKVYVVFFDLPFKTCTPDEWVAQAVKKGWAADAALKDYGPTCPELQSMCFPEDDLEVVKGAEVD